VSDEVGRLRERLEAGEWRALLDPLLPLLLLSDPGPWWPDAVDLLLDRILRQDERRMSARSRSLPEAFEWNRLAQQQTRLGRPLIDERTGRNLVIEANVAWARAVVRAFVEPGEEAAAMTRALDILEEWLWLPGSTDR
jgi:hypothetical protein